mgnify:CR=1 FL=1
MQYNQKAADVAAEVSKAVFGKPQTIRTIWMAMLAGGHVLIEDIPGVGKTTLALAFAFPVYFPTALLTEFASLLGYHAYLKMRYLLPMHYGAAALLIVLAVGIYFLADSLAGKNGQNEQKEKIRA